MRCAVTQCAASAQRRKCAPWSAQHWPRARLHTMYIARPMRRPWSNAMIFLYSPSLFTFIRAHTLFRLATLCGWRGKSFATLDTSLPTRRAAVVLLSKPAPPLHADPHAYSVLYCWLGRRVWPSPHSPIPGGRQGSTCLTPLSPWSLVCSR
jgi:hypothetical protein